MMTILKKCPLVDFDGSKYCVLMHLMQRKKSQLFAMNHLLKNQENPKLTISGVFTLNGNFLLRGGKDLRQNLNMVEN